MGIKEDTEHLHKRLTDLAAEARREFPNHHFANAILAATRYVARFAELHPEPAEVDVKPDAPPPSADVPPPPVNPFKDDPNAKEVRSDSGPLGEQGHVGEGSQGQSGTNF